MRRGTCLLLILLASLLPGCMTMQIAETDLLYPDHGIENAIRGGQVVERIPVVTEQGTIAVTRISQPGNKTVLLYCGGNQFRVERFGGRIVSGLPADVDLVMFDYPGYGDSTGKASIDALLVATLAVYDRVLMTGAAARQRHAVYGMSLGGFMAAHVAGARKPELLVLEATAPDAQRWADSMVPWYAEPFVDLQIDAALREPDNVEKLSDYAGAALLLVGSRDSQTKPALMRAFHEALRHHEVNARFEVIEGRGHGGVMSHPHAQEVIAGFLHAPRRATRLSSSSHHP